MSGFVDQMRCTSDQAWAAVFGATVAAQVRERMAEGRGPAGDDDMARFVEEAIAVADMAAEAIRGTP